MTTVAELSSHYHQSSQLGEVLRELTAATAAVEAAILPDGDYDEADPAFIALDHAYDRQERALEAVAGFIVDS
jgi:hypothetical protein